MHSPEFYVTTGIYGGESPYASTTEPASLEDEPTNYNLNGGVSTFSTRIVDGGNKFPSQVSVVALDGGWGGGGGSSSS